MVTKLSKKIVLEGDDSKEHLGLIHIITGEGKGKTTASLGMALRALGSNLNVYMIQFLKSAPTGEMNIIKKHLPSMEIIQFGIDAVKERQQKLDEFTDKGSTFVFNPDEEEKEAAQMAFQHAKKVIQSGNYDVVILDEINVALDKGLISLNDVMELLDSHGKTEMILTGRDAPAELKARAHYVSDVQRIKHPWMDGIKARKGIEY